MSFDHEIKMLKTEIRLFRWACKAIIELAKIELRDNPLFTGHKDHEWADLVGSSKSGYLHQVLVKLGIDHDEFLDVIRSGRYPVDDLFDDESEGQG